MCLAKRRVLFDPVNGCVAVIRAYVILFLIFVIRHAACATCLHFVGAIVVFRFIRVLQIVVLFVDRSRE